MSGQSADGCQEDGSCVTRAQRSGSEPWSVAGGSHRSAQHCTARVSRPLEDEDRGGPKQRGSAVCLCKRRRRWEAYPAVHDDDSRMRGGAAGARCDRPAEVAHVMTVCWQNRERSTACGVLLPARLNLGREQDDLCAGASPHTQKKKCVSYVINASRPGASRRLHSGCLEPSLKLAIPQ